MILLKMKTVVIIIPDNSCKLDCAGQTDHLVSFIMQKIKEEEGKRETEQKSKKQHDMLKIYYFT